MWSGVTLGLTQSESATPFNPASAPLFPYPLNITYILRFSVNIRIPQCWSINIWTQVDSDVCETAAEWVMQSGCDSKRLVNRTDTRLSSHNSSIPNRTGILRSSVVFGILSLTQTCRSRCLCDKKLHVLFLNRWQDLFEENQTDNKVSCTNEVWVLAKKHIK